VSAVVWFYEGQGGLLRYEIRRAPGDRGYELVITYPSGDEEIRRFRHPRALLEGTFRVQRALLQAGWRLPDPATQAALVRQLEALQQVEDGRATFPRPPHPLRR
jgi:hypothetical protein